MTVKSALALVPVQSTKLLLTNRGIFTSDGTNVTSRLCKKGTLAKLQRLSDFYLVIGISFDQQLFSESTIPRNEEIVDRQLDNKVVLLIVCVSRVVHKVGNMTQRKYWWNNIEQQYKCDRYEIMMDDLLEFDPPFPDTLENYEDYWKLYNMWSYRPDSAKYNEALDDYNDVKNLKQVKLDLVDLNIDKKRDGVLIYVNE